MKEIRPEDITINPFTLIGKNWLVLTAGNDSGYNGMTVSWGHLGCLWSPNRSTAVAYVRESRFTKEFMDKEELFTLSLIEDRKALGYLGSHSGREGNKFENAGVKPLFIDGTAAVEGAKLILVCKKLYSAPFDMNGFTDKTIPAQDYADGNVHTMYIGEIIKVLDNA